MTASINMAEKSLDFANAGWAKVKYTGTAHGALDMIEAAEAREPFGTIHYK